MKNSYLLGAVLGLFAVLPTAAQATVTVTPYTYTPDSNVGSTTDAFDASQGTVVTSDSGYNGVSRPENALGGSSPTTENQSLVFADNMQQPQTLDFMTSAPVMISGYNLYLAQDSDTNGNIRGFDTVALFGSLDGVSYTNLGGIDLTNPYQDGYGSNTVLVSSSFDPAAYQYFRFEGTPYDQGAFSEAFSGGRLVEIDAIGADAATPGPTGAVPEPASWAMIILGFGLIGAGLRARRRGTALRYA